MKSAVIEGSVHEHGIFDSLTERVIGAVLKVSNTLGAGFLERVYERALLTEHGLRGIRATAQASFTVTYKGHSVGEYFGRLSSSKMCWWSS
jgi:GxxExxY protein